MEEKNLELEKSLNKNYGKVQIEDNKLKDHLAKKEKEFLGNTKKITTVHNQEIKKQSATDKEIQKKFKDSLKVIKADHAFHLKDINNRKTGFEKDNKNAIGDSIAKNEKETKRLNDLLVVLNNDFEKLNADVLAQYNEDLEESEKRKVAFTEQSLTDINNLLSQLKEAQENYEILVSNLNEKRDEKQEKLTLANNKKIEKTQVEIEKEEAKTAKNINDLKLPYEEKLASIEEKLTVEKDKFTKKDSAIKSTLESKVARHEKFMNKSLRDNDNRAVKQHKKEIAVLEKNADRELKLLSKEHNDRYTVLKDKKNELMTNNLNKIASYETDLVKFKEERLYQIEMSKAVLSNEIEMSNLITRQTLEDELNKYNEYYAENEKLQASVKLNEELALEKEEDYQLNLKFTFDKTNKVNEVKHQEHLATREKDLKLSEVVMNSEQELSNIALEVELSKLDSEKEVSEKEILLSTKVNSENEFIEYHKNDFNKQATNNNEFYNFQNEVTSLLKDRAISVSSYETIELNNRVNLKVAFLESQLVLLDKDCSRITDKINSFYETEKATFEVEINKLAKDALVELAEFEEKSKEEIQALSDKRNALDPRAYKKEIRMFDKDIDNKNEIFEDELAKRKALIEQKTGLYSVALSEATTRRDNALTDISEYNTVEKEKLNKAIELIKRILSDETHNNVERLNTTVAHSGEYTESLSNRKNLLTDQNNKYLEGRIGKEEAIIKNSKELFEQEKHVLTTSLEQKLVELENKKNEALSNTSEQKLNEEKELERKVSEFDALVNKYNVEKEELVENQNTSLQSNKSRIELRNSNKLVEISKQLNEKVSKYKTNTVEVDRATDEESKKFDSEKKTTQRNYDSALSKGLLVITQKLQTDLKNI